MKRVLLSVCALALIVTSLGCACNCNNCRTQRYAAQCRDHQCGRGGLGSGGLLGSRRCGPCCEPEMAPMAAGVAYPYYTLRGPRDFLSSNPRGIGP